MTVCKIEPARLCAAKRSFTTRRVPIDQMRTLIFGALRPEPGDLVLARVDTLGKHKRIEQPDGRKAQLFPNDEIIVSFGNRYATDQFEAVVGDDLAPCHLVAAGGVAAREIARHGRIAEATRITPVGLLGGPDGVRLNLRAFGLSAGPGVPQITTIAVLGTAMNAGKTLTAASLIRGYRRRGYRVAGIKATGTGAGGDLWLMRDAGADLVLDFTDAGYASTFLLPVCALENATMALLQHAAQQACDLAVVEIADGMNQRETAGLIQSPRIRSLTSAVVFAAYDSMGAKCGVDMLRDAGYAVAAVSGRLSQSPLAMREAASTTGLNVLTPCDLQDGALDVPVLRAAPCWPARPLGIAQAALGPAFYAGALARVASRIMACEIRALRERLSVDGRPPRRNGYRHIVWRTCFGPAPLNVPRLRRGGYRPGFLATVSRNAAVLRAAVVRAATSPDREQAVAALLEHFGGPALSAEEFAALCADAAEWSEAFGRRDAFVAGEPAPGPIFLGDCGFAPDPDEDEAAGAAELSADFDDDDDPPFLEPFAVERDLSRHLARRDPSSGGWEGSDPAHLPVGD